MHQRGLDRDSYYHAAVFADIADPVVNEYLRQRAGIAGVNAIYAERVPAALWRVRSFPARPAAEVAVGLRPEGAAHPGARPRAGEAPGASRTQEEGVAGAGESPRRGEQNGFEK